MMRAFVLAIALLAVAPVGAEAQRPPAGSAPELVLSPSRAEGEAQPRIEVGPFGLLNATTDSYRVRVVPVLLAQDRRGGVTVREDVAALDRARRYLRPSDTRFHLAPGERRTASGMVERLPRKGSLYGGLLFQARQASADPEQQISEILRLTASVLLAPPSSGLRVALTAGHARAEQADEAIRLLIPVRNRGNAYLPAEGTWRLRDARGVTVAADRLGAAKILPGYTVDLAGRLKRTLAAGSYRLQAEVRMRGATARSTGTIEIGADGEVVYRAAKLGGLSTPTAYRGEPVEIEAEFLNTGNAEFAPRAEVVVRPIESGRVGDAASPQPLSATVAQPGDTGSVSGEIELPSGAPAYELALRLLDGERELDTAGVTVTPTAAPGTFARIRGWVTNNAVVLVAVLIALLAAAALVAWWAVRAARRRPTPAAAPARRVAAPIARRRPQPRPAASPRGRAGAEPGTATRRLSLRAATSDDLRGIGLSITQARRLLRYRDAADEAAEPGHLLDQVPGFPADLRRELKRRMRR